MDFKSNSAFSKNPEHSFEIISVSATSRFCNELVNRKNDLVVMGTEETEDKDITFGSNTLQVIKYVNCPVWLPSVYGETHHKFVIPYRLHVAIKEE